MSTYRDALKRLARTEVTKPYAPPPHLAADPPLVDRNLFREDPRDNDVIECPECGSRDEWANGYSSDYRCLVCGVEFNEEDLAPEPPEPDLEAETFDDYDDWDTFQASKTAGVTLQGALAGAPVKAFGIAIMPEQQSPDEIAAMIATLSTHRDDLARQQEVFKDQPGGMYNNPWVNRGGSVQVDDHFFETLESKESAGLFELGPGADTYTWAPGYIVVGNYLSTDQAPLFLDKKCVGVVAGTGGTTSHGAQVALGRGLAAIVDVGDISAIKPGDEIEIDGATGGIYVNGGSGERLKEPGQQAHTGITRWVWSQGNFLSAPLDPENPEKDTHIQLMGRIPFNYEDGTFGTVYDDGVVEVYNEDFSDRLELVAWLEQIAPGARIEFKDFNMAYAKTAAVLTTTLPPLGWHNSCIAMANRLGLQGTITYPNGTVLDVKAGQNFMPMIMILVKQEGYTYGELDKVPVTVEVDDEDAFWTIWNGPGGGQKRNAASDMSGAPITCPECGSHTIKLVALNRDYGGKSLFVCYRDGTEFEAEVFANPRMGANLTVKAAEEGKHTPGTRVNLVHKNKKGRGTIVEFSGKHDGLGEERYKVLLDSGEEVDDVPDTAFERIKSASDYGVRWIYDPVSDNVIFDEENKYPGHQRMMFEFGKGDIDRIGQMWGGVLYSGEAATAYDADIYGSLTREEVERLVEERAQKQHRADSLSAPESSIQKEAPGKKHVDAWSPKRNRQYEHILESCKEEHPDWSEDRCKELAARTVNKTRDEKNETKSSADRELIHHALYDLYDGLATRSPRTIDGIKHDMPLTSADEVAERLEYARSLVDASQIHAKLDQIKDAYANGFVDEAEQIAGDLLSIYTEYIAKSTDEDCGCDSVRMGAITVNDSAGQPLKVKGWYTLHSTKYKVPDVIQVLDYDDHKIEAAIEGDNNSFFPIYIDAGDLATFSFHPYEPQEEERIELEGKLRLASKSRRKFSPAEQQELIHENPEGIARNFDKLDLAGTHYTIWERVDQDDDDLESHFLF